MDFTTYPVERLQSIGHLVPPGSRRGIYRLRFADGERYVGLSHDVVRRFAQHLERWNDVVEIDFCAVPEAALPPLETSEIHAEQARGYSLRNERFAIGAAGPSDLDEAVTPSQQDVWLTAADAELDTADLGDGPRRSFAVTTAHRRAFDKLASRPNSPIAAQLLAAYVHGAVPRPRDTEGRFWGVSAAPSTGADTTWRRLAVVSVHSMETFVVGETAIFARDDDWLVRGIVVVSASRLVELASRSLDELRASYAPVLSFGGPRYEAAGGDDVSISWSGIEESIAALEEIPWTEAARPLVIRLMRKGVSLQSRWHNPLLAGLLLDDPEG